MPSRTFRQDPPEIPVHSGRALPRVELEIARGEARQRMRQVKGPVFLIGAASDCDLVLGDPQFEEVQLYMYVTEEGVSLRHLGAEPSVTVSGRVVETAWLRDGDRIRTGPYEFTVHITWPDKTPLTDEEFPNWLETLPSRGAVEAAPPEQAVRALLEDVRSMLVAARPLLTLYVDPEVPWQSVTASRGLSIKRNSA